MAAPLSPPPAPAESLSPLLRQSLNGFAALTGDGVYVFVSESLCTLLQLSKVQLLGCAATHALLPPLLLAPAPNRRIQAVSDCSRSRSLVPRPMLRRRMADFLFPEHRQTLEKQLGATGGDPPYTVLLHACGDGAGLLAGWLPLEVKACASESLTFLVMQDARIPTRLESRLSKLLLYTSALIRTTAASRRFSHSVPFGFPMRRPRSAHACCQHPSGDGASACKLSVFSGPCGCIAPAHGGFRLHCSAALREQLAWHARSASGS